ncbi:MAG: hypothetical protein NTU49_00900 [Gammaproteobacteria bacterium]|nr:hypothetical protein [Gammaproteobacteria bacterium]
MSREYSLKIYQEEADSLLKEYQNLRDSYYEKHSGEAVNLNHEPLYAFIREQFFPMTHEKIKLLCEQTVSDEASLFDRKKSLSVLLDDFTEKLRGYKSILDKYEKPVLSGISKPGAQQPLGVEQHPCEELFFDMEWMSPNFCSPTGNNDDRSDTPSYRGREGLPRTKSSPCFFQEPGQPLPEPSYKKPPVLGDITHLYYPAA